MRALIPFMLLAVALPVLACRSEPTAPPSSELTPSVAVAAGSWTTRAPYPRDWWAAASAAVTLPATGHSTLYVIGGGPPFANPGQISTLVKAYDVERNTWKPRAPLPVRAWETHGAVAIDGKIYVSGGLSRRHEVLRTLFVYDPSADRWTRLADLPVAAFSGVSAAYRGQLYVATDCLDADVCNGDLDHGALWRYDPSRDTWLLLTRTPQGPRFGGGGFIGGKFYLLTEEGGSAVYVYDVAADAWSAGPSRPGPSTCLPSYVTAQAKLYVTCPPASGVGLVLQVLDPGTGWSTLGAIPQDAGGPSYTMSRVQRGGRTLLELVGGNTPTNNLQFTP